MNPDKNPHSDWAGPTCNCSYITITESAGNKTDTVAKWRKVPCIPRTRGFYSGSSGGFSERALIPRCAFCHCDCCSWSWTPDWKETNAHPGFWLGEECGTCIQSKVPIWFTLVLHNTPKIKPVHCWRKMHSFFNQNNITEAFSPAPPPVPKSTIHSPAMSPQLFRKDEAMRQFIEALTCKQKKDIFWATWLMTKAQCYFWCSLGRGV